jgi:hypothetical protein
MSAVRQGLTLNVEFGSHSIEALIWVAETVEEGVYEPHSLSRTEDGLTFALDNPPLRVGAFTSVRLLVDSREIPAERVRFRRDAGSPWRSADTVAPGHPWELAPGVRTEFWVAGAFAEGSEPISVRLELRTPAIPPRVWFEFTESPGTGDPAR